MRQRLKFVSNSSSSSFIIIDESKNYNIPKYDTTLVVDGKLGETEFGWQEEEYSDFGSKLIFSYLQTIYANYNGLLKMLEEVVKENTGAPDIQWNIQETWSGGDGKDNGYIDHASSACEGRNIDIFYSKETLKDFLFNPLSYIHNDNDNH
jgi:hypothetical protein